jgi:hypothetical protein
MNENNVIAFFNGQNGKEYINNKGKKIKLDLTSLDSFKEKMSTKEKRLEMFNKVWGAGLSLFGKYNDFEKKYGGESSPTNVKTNPILQKLISLLPSIRRTTNPDQAVFRGKDKSVFTYYSNGKYEQRDGGSVNGPIIDKGKWYFVGDDNYQMVSDKVDDNGNFMVWNFKTGERGWTTVKSSNPQGMLNLQKLMKIDVSIEKTKFSDTVFCSFKEDGKNRYWIFWSDGDWRQRNDRFDNREGQDVGTWKLIGENDYQITSNGKTWNFSGTNDWVDI